MLLMVGIGPGIDPRGVTEGAIGLFAEDVTEGLGVGTLAGGDICDVLTLEFEGVEA